MTKKLKQNSGTSAAPPRCLDFIEELRKAAKCVFIAVDAGIARDLASKLNKSADLLGMAKVDAENLSGLKAEWEAQGNYLNNPHDDPVDRAVGKTYLECAGILGDRFGV